MTQNPKKKMWWGIGLGAIVVLGIAAVAAAFGPGSKLLGLESGPAHAQGTLKHEDGHEDPAAITVRTIRPKRDASLEVCVEQPAFVEAYYHADLEARVAGPVKFIEKTRGDRVKAGEKLVEIDVPDLVQEVAQRKAVVEQKKADLACSQSAVLVAQAGADAVDKKVKEADSRVLAAQEEKEFRRKEYYRFKKLAAGPNPAVTPDLVDERLKWFNVAGANKLAAEAAVLRACADLEESRQKVEVARAEIDLKKALIRVAEEDVRRAEAMLELATIRAPFDGVVTRRTVDPGSFVHSAATSTRSEPLLTIERTDMVTVYMKVPDKYAPYVCPETEAIIELNELPGDQIRAKLTRFTPSLQTQEHDRTMRAEVDLFNGSKDEYQHFLAHEAEVKNADLKGRALPVFPQTSMTEGSNYDHHLLPGMYGTMRLVLRKLRGIYLVPSQVVVSHGGTPFIFLVDDGIVRRVPVRVQMDDGKLARIRLIVEENGRKVRRDLTGKEEIVSSNQGELSDGQLVEPTPTNW